MKKSQLIQFFLTLLFGPVGLFYTSVAAAIGFVIVTSAIGTLTMGIGFLFVWPVTILVGFFTTSRYNALIDKEDKKHLDLIQATKYDDSA